MTNDITPDTTTDLYRYFDGTGQLLYVGISMHAAIRAMGHRGSAGWWTTWTRCDVEKHPNRQAALAAERQAIIDEKPKYNIVHNRAGKTPNIDPGSIDDRLIAGLIGLFFVTPHPTEGFPKLQWQGLVVDEISAGIYLVALFSWMDGSPNGQQLVSLEQMMAWEFYPTHEEWLHRATNGWEPYRA